MVVSTAEAILVSRALCTIPWTRETVCEAFVAVIATSARDAARLRMLFATFFGEETPPRDIFERLRRKGATEAEITFLRELVTEATRTWAEGSAAFDHVVYRGLQSSALFALSSPLQLGFYAKTMAHAWGATKARDDLSVIEPALRDAFGEGRSRELLALIEGEVRTQESFVRSALAERVDAARPPEGSGQDKTSFAALDPAEYERARLAVRSFAKRLGGGARTRARRRGRGSIDLRGTLRASFQTFGSPMKLCYRRRERQRPKLWILCDISDSVRAASTFILEFAYAAQELFAKTRSFVFVSELAEATSLFRARAEASSAIHAATSLVAGTHNSNYGLALRTFLDRYGRELDARTTLVILGDGRTNYLAPDASALAEVKKRVRGIYWLAPEAASSWATGDSALATYRPHVTRMLSVTSVAELERAARLLLRRSA